MTDLNETIRELFAEKGNDNALEELNMALRLLPIHLEGHFVVDDRKYNELADDIESNAKEELKSSLQEAEEDIRLGMKYVKMEGMEDVALEHLDNAIASMGRAV